MILFQWVGQYHPRSSTWAIPLIDVRYDMTAQPVAGTSDNAKVKQEKREGKRAAITIDLSDDDMPLVKREKSSNAKAASGVKKEQVVIVIDD
jgi:hypothetical protein